MCQEKKRDGEGAGGGGVCWIQRQWEVMPHIELIHIKAQCRGCHEITSSTRE